LGGGQFINNRQEERKRGDRHKLLRPSFELSKKLYVIYQTPKGAHVSNDNRSDPKEGGKEPESNEVLVKYLKLKRNVEYLRRIEQSGEWGMLRKNKEKRKTARENDSTSAAAMTGRK